MICLYDFLIGKNNKKKKNQVQLKINNIYLKIKKLKNGIDIKNRKKKVIIITQKNLFIFS